MYDKYWKQDKYQMASSKLTLSDLASIVSYMNTQLWMIAIASDSLG